VNYKILDFAKKKHKFLLIFFVVLFVLVTIIKTAVGAKLYSEHEERFAYQQAKILNTYIVEFRHYYQGLFINKSIMLDKETLRALPAFALVPINEKFSNNNLFKVSVKAVSDNVRNPVNKADKFELTSMEYFRNNPEATELFQKVEEDGRKFYQYTSALRIGPSCVKCHSTPENAPKFISETYKDGYGYKLNDLRGVLSVKIPTEHIQTFFKVQELTALGFDALIFLLLILLLVGIYRILSLFNEELSKQVEEKTKEISAAMNDIYHYKKTLDDSSIVSIANKKGVITYVNENFSDISGYSKEEVIGKTHSIIRHPDTPKSLFEDMWSTILSKNTWKGTIKNRKKDGSYYVVDATIEPILGADGEIIEFMAVRHDVTPMYDKQVAIEKMATTDSLTNLFNRTKLLLDIKDSKTPTIAIFDIDSFTDINDFYGHETGDEVLREFGVCIGSELDDGMKLYRYSGDRFVVLADGYGEDDFAKQMQKIQLIINSREFVCNNESVYIQASVAMSFEDNENLIRTAEMVLAEAKKKKVQFLIYDKALKLEDEIKKNIEWSIKLKNALENDRIVPYFQPILNNSTRKIEKYECLVRMIDSDGSVISPYFFLGVAKRSKQYISLTKKMIEKSFDMLTKSKYQFSINLTIEDILSQEVNAMLNNKICQDEYRGKVVFEIVESEGIENLDMVTAFVAKAKEYLCAIAIDDFGTGYSNFDYLIKLNPDFIKIDGSMIRDIDKNVNNQEIVKTIIDFAKKRNLKTIAEFVSSKEVFEKVIELGIDYSQGYFIGEPKPDLITDGEWI